MNKVELSVEKSQEQAELIKLISLPIIALDVEYCRELAKAMIDQSLRQQAIGILNPGFDQVNSEILAKQGRALLNLCDYVDALKEVDALKQKLANNEKIREEINKLFM